MKYRCDRCGRRYGSHESANQHRAMKHGGTCTFSFVSDEVREETMAERAIQAEMDISMGISTDDGWLLP